MAEHVLKTWPPHFDALASGLKTFELRIDDRDYAVGDELRLREWMSGESAHGAGIYTGRECRRRVTHVLRDAQAFGLRPGHCIMSLAPAEA